MDLSSMFADSSPDTRCQRRSIICMDLIQAFGHTIIVCWLAPRGGGEETARNERIYTVRDILHTILSAQPGHCVYYGAR